MGSAPVETYKFAIAHLRLSTFGEVGSPRTVRQASAVIFKMTAVIASPMSGSATGRPRATTAALPTTPSETYPSTRAWAPSASRAVGQQGDRAGQDEHADLSDGGDGEDGEARGDRLDAFTRPDDRRVDSTMGVAVTMRMVAVGVICHARTV